MNKMIALLTTFLLLQSLCTRWITSAKARTKTVFSHLKVDLLNLMLDLKLMCSEVVRWHFWSLVWLHKIRWSWKSISALVKWNYWQLFCKRKHLHSADGPFNLFEIRTTFIKTTKFYTRQAHLCGWVVNYTFTSIQLTQDNMPLNVNYSLYID